MIYALLIGRKGSKGFPGKNTYKVMGKPLCYYPSMAAKKTIPVNQIKTVLSSPGSFSKS